ncbi:hypothetical protein [Meiothermus sp.]|uniref:hypothetical protein n=1 Tax=Meiothermus sp. TaxID=1955249 RepID=UPI0021DCB063|nr:hypothetical protein [Meiothermus sp.]GIW33124.1 MAG: hypothetical protein KatS3mg072_0457 [Meiothermus sp.]
MKEQAILIMTSEGPPGPGLRSAAPSSGWTKLFQARDYYLDLSYKHDGQQGLLLGQLLCEGKASVGAAKLTLVDPEGTPLQTEEVVPNTGFRLVVGDVAAHRLLLTLDQTTFEVALS